MTDKQIVMAILNIFGVDRDRLVEAIQFSLKDDIIKAILCK